MVRLYLKSNFSATANPQIFQVCNLMLLIGQCTIFKFSLLIGQKTLDASVDKRMESTFGPPIGKTMTIFIDDQLR